MEPRIIGHVISNSGVKHYVRYCYDDDLLQISTYKTGPWFVVMDQYQLDENALKYAKEFVDSVMT